MSEEISAATIAFKDLGLPAPLMQALLDVGYENPSPIQAQTIPFLLAGRDVLGQAQTGTGKTAAFALPMLASINVELRAVQAVVLAPTRELAIQVAEAFQKYAVHMKGFNVLPIYGGASYNTQLSGLRRGAQVVVGTPGRVMDHIKRGTLKLESLKFVALDEADEMLRMGFIDDVEWILQQMPTQRQVALFSATMPPQVRRIAQTHLNNPAEVTIRNKTTTAANIRQRYWQVSGLHKLDALTRILEAESFDAMIIFARTKASTEELAERLEARGFAVSALNGDMPQQQRERTVQRLRDGQLDILVATDVAARGLNVERISHVVNFDIPMDIESYVHRIGRTGRAGRSGEAILFVSPRERRMLSAIERATRQPIEPMELPTVEDVNNQRIARFKGRITESLEAGGLELFRDVVEQFEHEQNVPAVEIAAALARMAQGKTPLFMKTSVRAERPGDARPPRDARDTRAPVASPPREARPAREPVRFDEEAAPVRKPREEARSEAPAERPPRAERPARFEKPERAPRSEHSESAPRAERPERATRPQSSERPVAAPRRNAEIGMETYRVAGGSTHEVKPANIVCAIANEAGIDSKYIGRIEIFDTYSTVDLPQDMPKEILQHLKKVWVAGQELRISLERPAKGAPVAAREAPVRAPRPILGRGGERPAPAGMAPREARPHKAADGSSRKPYSGKTFAKGPKKTFSGSRPNKKRD